MEDEDRAIYDSQIVKESELGYQIRYQVRQKLLEKIRLLENNSIMEMD